MSEQARAITRQELYEAVWKSPMSKLAPQWGSTAAAIVKACEKMNVPRPGSGHWALVVRGWEIERTPLPEPKASAPTSVSLVPPQKRQRVPRKTEQPRPAAPAIKVPRDFSRVHALVKQTRRAFTSNFYLHKGFVQARDFENVRLSLTISREQVDRALLICDAVIREAIERGVKLQAPGTSLATLLAGKQVVDFWIREAMKRHDLDLTDEEKKARGISTWERFDWKGTGLLRLTVRAPGLFSRVWEDSKRLSLEAQLGDVMETIVGAEAEGKRVMAERVEAERRREEAWRRELEAQRKEEERRKEVERRRREEEENRNRLVTMARNWREVRLVRRFIRACEGVLGQESQPQGDWREQWVTWAKAHADRLDPMTNGYLESERRRLAGGENC